MLFINDVEDESCLIIVFDDLPQVLFVLAHFLLHFFHYENFIALLLIDALGQLRVHDLLDLLVVRIPQVQHLLVICPRLVVLDIKVLLLKQGSPDALNVVEKGLSLET